MQIPNHNPSSLTAVTGHADPLSVMGRVLGPAETPRIDRRRFLKFMALAGATGAAGTALWEAKQPQPTSEIDAPQHQDSTKAKEDLNTLKRASTGLYGPASQMQSLHQSLFYRAYSIEYQQEHEHCTTDCDTDCDSDGNNCTTDCTTTCTTYYTTEYENESLWIDGQMAKIKSGYLNHLLSRYSGITSLVDAILTKKRMEITGGTQNINIDGMSSEEFAAHFGYAWKEGQVSTGKKVALSTVIGATGLTGFLFYKPIFDWIANAIGNINGRRRSYSGSSRRQLFQYDASDGDDITNYRQITEEKESTRRAFFQMLLGGLTLGLTLHSKEKHQKRSKNIRDTAEFEMRKSIVENNQRNQEKLFEKVFDIHAAGLIAEAKSLVTNLRDLDERIVTKAVEKGTVDLVRFVRDRKNQIENSAGKSDARILHIDDDMKQDLIRQYVQTAYQAADELENKIAILETLFANGVPESMRSPLRAYQITLDTESSIAKQHSRHMWGLAGDLGAILGGVTALSALSEIDGVHDEAANHLVHGAFDWWDRKKMTAWGVITGMKQNYSANQMSQIFDSGDYDILAVDQINALKRAAKDYVEMGVVQEYQNPVLKEYLLGQQQRSAGSVETMMQQLEQVNPDDVINVYVEKAFVYFAKKQLSLKGLKRDILISSNGGRDIIKNPPFAEFKNKVEELMRNAGPGFIFDLIDAGVIQDNQPDEDWQDAEANELPGYINYWADRIAGTVAASTNMFVALRILPQNWFNKGDTNHESLTRADILEAFARYCTSQKDKFEKFKKAFNNSKATERAVSENEYLKRFLFKEIKDAMDSQRFWDFLSQESPKLKAALAAAG